MTWIHIDAERGMTIGRVMLDSGHRSVALLDHLRSLAGVPGLGAAQGDVAEVVASSAAAIDRAINSYLEEGIDMMRRLLALLQEQAAGSVVGQVVSPAVALATGTVVGGYSSVSAKSWVQSTPITTAHTDRFGNTYDVVFDPRANELLGAGTGPGELHFTAAGEPYYVHPAPLAATGVAAAIPSADPAPAGRLPARMSLADYNKLFNDQLVTLAMPPMWAAKTLSAAISTAYSSPIL